MVDTPGAISNATKIMADAGISIEAIIQKQQPAGIDYVNVVLVTNRLPERRLNAAVSEIEDLSTVQGSVTTLRLEHLDQ